MKLTETEIESKNIDWSSDKIAVNTFTNKSILELSESYDEIAETLKKYIDHDFILYMHLGTKSYFIKRKLVSKIWQRKDLHQIGDLFYTIDNPKGDRINSMVPQRMIVNFSSLPAFQALTSANIARRALVKLPLNYIKGLLKNVIVVNVMDLNKIYGSSYLNTDNYLSFETDVQEMIKEVSEVYNVLKEDIVLFGVHKGGTAALYHSLLGDYKSLSVDPFLTSKDCRMSFPYSLYDILPSGFSKIMTQLSQKEKNYEFEKFVLSSALLPENFALVNKIKEMKKVNVSYLYDNNFQEVDDVPNMSLNAQLTILNNFWLKSKNKRKNNEILTNLVDYI